MIIGLFKELYAYRELLFAFTYRDIQVKYKQAAMGMMWAFFMPILAISTGVAFRVVMAYSSGREIEMLHIFGVLVKSVPWVMFAGVVGGASTSLVGNMNLITKIYFPREIVPMSSLLSSLFDFSINMIGLTVLIVVISVFYTEGTTPIAVSWGLLWVPVLLTLLVLLAGGLGLFFSCANLFFRDVKYIVQVLLQFGIFFSLVFFSYDEFGSWGWVLLLNPVAPLLEGLRTSVLTGEIEPFLRPWVAYSGAVAVLGFLSACAVFEKAEYLFAEYV